MLDYAGLCVYCSSQTTPLCSKCCPLNSLVALRNIEHYKLSCVVFNRFSENHRRRQPVSHHTSPAGCRGRSTAGGAASRRGTRSPPSGPSTAPGPSRSRSRGRTETCRPAGRPDTGGPRGTRRLQRHGQGGHLHGQDVLSHI